MLPAKKSAQRRLIRRRGGTIEIRSKTRGGRRGNRCGGRRQRRVGPATQEVVAQPNPEA